MKKSNIYVYYELSKMVEEFNAAGPDGIKQTLKAKSAYFNIIEPRYFSEQLAPDWQSIISVVNHKDQFDHLSTPDCLALVEKIEILYERVKAEVFDESLMGAR